MKQPRPQRLTQISRGWAGALSLFGWLGLASAQSAPASLPASAPGSLPASAPASLPADWVRGIEVRGALLVSSDDIRDKIGHPVEAPLDEAQVTEDLKAVFSLGTLRDVSASFEENSLIFTVTEAPALVALSFRGDLPQRDRALRRRLDLGPTRPLDRAKLEAGVRALEDELRRDGYHFLSITHELVELSPATEEAPARAALRLTLRDDRMVKVGAIDVEGNRALSSDALRAALTSAPRGRSFWTRRAPFSDLRVEEDLLRLLGRYLDEGYLDAKIEPTAPEIAGDPPRASLRLVVQEGPQYAVSSLAFTGDWDEPAASLEKKVSARVGAPFRRGEVGGDAEALARSLRDQGFADAQVTPIPEKDPRAHRVALTYELRRGPVYTVRRIVVRGNDKTAEAVIRRELSLGEGERYHQTKLDESRKKILGLGFFSRVELTTSRADEPNQLDVEISVQEVRVPIVPSAGLGSGPVLGALQWYALNLFGRGHTLTASLFLEPGAQFGLQTSATARYTAPHVFDSPAYLLGEAKHQERALPGLLFGESSGAAQLSYPLNKHIWLAAAYTLSYQGGGLFGLSATAVPDELAVLGRRGLLEGAFEYDWRDARQHYAFAADGGAAARALGSQASYLRAGGRASAERAFGSVDRPILVRAKLSAEGITPRAGEVPYTDRLFVGGLGSVRGFLAFGLGPALEDGTLIGGTRAITTGLEVELPVIKTTLLTPIAQIRRPIGLALCLFADAGDAFAPKTNLALAPAEKDWGLLPLRTAWGAGLRYDGPWLGVPVRVDVARPVDPRPGETFQVHIYMGTPF